MAAVGKAFTVTTVAVEVDEQLFAFVTVTIYEPAIVAEYVAFVAPAITPAALFQ